MKCIKKNTHLINVIFCPLLFILRYIQNPLLLKGRKFDVRSYFLIACTQPYMVFFRHGYIRLTCNPYDPNSDNITAHLTNQVRSWMFWCLNNINYHTACIHAVTKVFPLFQYMQKKNPLYSFLKEETVWSMEHFNAYINETYMLPKGLPQDWALGSFTVSCIFSHTSKIK